MSSAVISAKGLGPLLLPGSIPGNRTGESVQLNYFFADSKFLKGGSAADKYVSKHVGEIPFSITFRSNGQATNVPTAPRRTGNDLLRMIDVYGSDGAAATRSFAAQNHAVDAGSRILPYGVEARVKGGHICVAPAGEGSVLLVFFQNNSGEIHVALVGESGQVAKVVAAMMGKSCGMCVHILDAAGAMHKQKSMPSSKSGWATVLKAAGGATVAAGLAMLIGMLAELVFFLSTFLIALALVIVGVLAFVGYEFFSDNPAI
ncbi:MAG: hypothetical protein LBI39_03330 [Puniceicoccales bacterium]|jgi:hypothetical protein|nr:hypothetical protein [Puniceicoccales bacterium]